MKQLKWIYDVVIKQNVARGIKNSNDVFSYIDSPVISWDLNTVNTQELETEFSVYEIMEDSTFEQIFDIKTDIMPQAQIIEFCKLHRDKLQRESRFTFFLFERKGDTFVACIRDLHGELRLEVVNFSGGIVWGAEKSRRIVVPKVFHR